MEKLLADWGAVPNDHMRALLNEFRTIPDHGRGMHLERVGGASIDDHSEVLFEFWRNASGRWNIVAVISAKQVDWEPIWRNAERRKAGTIGPRTQPAVAP